MEGLAAMASFFFAYLIAGWRPWEALASSGDLYLQATTMTMAGIVMAQVRAGLAWRTNSRSLFTVGLFSNRLLLVGIGVETRMIALLAYVPGLAGVFHMSSIWPVALALPAPVAASGHRARGGAQERRAPAPREILREIPHEASV